MNEDIPPTMDFKNDENKSPLPNNGDFDNFNMPRKETMTEMSKIFEDEDDFELEAQLPDEDHLR
jgi:hypothetical protein